MFGCKQNTRTSSMLMVRRMHGNLPEPVNEAEVNIRPFWLLRALENYPFWRSHVGFRECAGENNLKLLTSCDCTLQ